MTPGECDSYNIKPQYAVVLGSAFGGPAVITTLGKNNPRLWGQLDHQATDSARSMTDLLLSLRKESSVVNSSRQEVTSWQARRDSPPGPGHLIRLVLQQINRQFPGENDVEPSFGLGANEEKCWVKCGGLARAKLVHQIVHELKFVFEGQQHVVYSELRFEKKFMFSKSEVEQEKLLEYRRGFAECQREMESKLIHAQRVAYDEGWEACLAHEARAALKRAQSTLKELDEASDD